MKPELPPRYRILIAVIRTFALLAPRNDADSKSASEFLPEYRWTDLLPALVKKTPTANL